MQRHAPLGQRERLLVVVAHQRDVGLVVHDPGEHVVGLDGHGEPFALAQRGGGFVSSARLGEQHGRQRMHEREVPAIAGRVQSRSGLGQVLSNDARVADLLVTERQLVMGESDGAGLVRELSMLQGTGMQRDGARLFAAREGDPAMQPPQRRQLRVWNRIPQRIGRPSEYRGGLHEIVLEEPGFGQRGADRELVFARERTRPEAGRQQVGRFGPAAAIEGRVCAAERRLHRRGRH